MSSSNVKRRRNGNGGNSKTGNGKRYTTAEKCEAIAAYLVEGVTQDVIAKRAGVSRATFANWYRDYRGGKLNVDDFLVAHRARIIPALVELQARATLQAVAKVGGETSSLKAALTAKAAGEMISRATGEADIIVEVRDPADARAVLLAAIKRRRDAIQAENDAAESAVH